MFMCVCFCCCSFILFHLLHFILHNQIINNNHPKLNINLFILLHSKISWVGFFQYLQPFNHYRITFHHNHLSFIPFPSTIANPGLSSLFYPLSPTPVFSAPLQAPSKAKDLTYPPLLQRTGSATPQRADQARKQEHIFSLGKKTGPS